MKKWILALSVAIVLISTSSGFSQQAEGSDTGTTTESSPRGKVDTGS
ncbi:hypothetical protein [Alkalicoccobacillus porphyridii]|nr:hypothetical protein [Alkalicoccobacillus porphyridii]